MNNPAPAAARVRCRRASVTNGHQARGLDQVNSSTTTTNPTPTRSPKPRRKRVPAADIHTDIDGSVVVRFDTMLANVSRTATGLRVTFSATGGPGPSLVGDAIRTVSRDLSIEVCERPDRKAGGA